MKMPAEDSPTGKESAVRNITMPLRVRRILVAADSFPENSKKVLQYPVRLARKFNAPLELLYGIASMRDLKKAKLAPLNAEVAEAGNILARARTDDLIIISAQGQTGRSVAEQLVRHAPCPVVVVRNQKPGYRASAFPFRSRGLTKRPRESL